MFSEIWRFETLNWNLEFNNVPLMSFQSTPYGSSVQINFVVLVLKYYIIAVFLEIKHLE